MPFISRSVHPGSRPRMLALCLCLSGATSAAQSQTPFGANGFPGVIKAQDFDQGGEGVAYHDSDAVNSPASYRPNEAVDIGIRGSGTYEVRASPGEWLEYTVNVAQGGRHELDWDIERLSAENYYYGVRADTSSHLQLSELHLSQLREGLALSHVSDSKVSRSDARKYTKRGIRFIEDVSNLLVEDFLADATLGDATWPQAAYYENCVALRNKRNFRLWNDSAQPTTLNNVLSAFAQKHDTYSTAGLWSQGYVEVYDSTFYANAGSEIVLENNATPAARVKLVNSIASDATARGSVATREGGTTLEWVDSRLCDGTAATPVPLRAPRADWTGDPADAFNPADASVLQGYRPAP